MRQTQDSVPLHRTQFELRPLSTGEILDRTFSLYRMLFWLCTSITLVAGLVSLGSGVFRLIFLSVHHLSPLTGGYSSAGFGVLSALWALLGTAAYGLAHAALVWAVGRSYLGGEASFSTAYRFALLHWVRYPALLIAQLFSAGWVTIAAYALLFGTAFLLRSQGKVTIAIFTGIFALIAAASLPYSIYRYIRVSLAMPAAVLGGLTIRAALQRSKGLLTERKGRVFVALLLVGALYMVLGSILGLLGFLSMSGRVSATVLQAGALSSSLFSIVLLQPILTIATVLLYYDERVRREGFDIEHLMMAADLREDAVQTFPGIAATGA